MTVFFDFEQLVHDVKEYAVCKGLHSRSIADSALIDRTSLRRWLAGELPENPSVHTVLRLCEFADLDMMKYVKERVWDSRHGRVVVRSVS